MEIVSEKTMTKSKKTVTNKTNKSTKKTPAKKTSSKTTKNKKPTNQTNAEVKMQNSQTTSVPVDTVFNTVSLLERVVDQFKGVFKWGLKKD
jgi:hypothetical protein